MYAAVSTAACAVACHVTSESLQGKALACSATAAVLASSMFSFKVKGSIEEIQNQLDIHAHWSLTDRRAEVYDEVSFLSKNIILFAIT